MCIGLIGTKSGMTRIFVEDGRSIPVSVIALKPLRITQIKTLETDNYCAIQVTTGEKKASRVNKPLMGHYAKADVVPGRGLWEFVVKDVAGYSLGQEIDISTFKEGQKVNIVGCSRGKGFAGVIKRHNFKSQRASHGNSISHNAPGSIGQNQTPGRVFKGKKMAGHMGDIRVTVRNLEIIRIEPELNAILVKGAIPGAPGGDVIIYNAQVNKTKSAGAA